jgi:glycosyltransferase involved in cell wall biosynthesis
MKTPIPILYIIDHFHVFSGTERHLFELVRRIDKAAFKPFVVAFQGSEFLRRRMADIGVPLRILDISRIYGARPLKLLFELRSFIRRENIGIVQTFHTKADLYGIALARLSGVPVIISSRRDLAFDRTSKEFYGYKLLNRYVDRILCVSEKVREFVMREENIEAQRCAVIHNGIETANFARHIDPQRERLELGIGPHVRVVGMLANFNPIKGHQFFLEACPRILRSAPDTVFVLAGLGPTETAMRRKAGELGVEARVRFVGHNEDISKILSVMDILVAPSLSEGFSNTILEAMYMEKAVIATRVGGNPEVVIEGETGILIEPGRSHEIADAVIRLLCDQSQILRLGNNARALIERRFLIQHMVDRTECLYRTLLWAKGLAVPDSDRAVAV